MAQKEASVFIVDVGSTMGEKGHGRDQTNLDWTLEYVWDRITSIVATGRKTNLAAIVALRTDDTENPLDGGDGYEHIKVLKNLDQVLMLDIRDLRPNLLLSNTDAGDATSALVVAIAMITEKCKKLQYQRRIFLLTDARSRMETDDLSHITAKIKEDNIELTVLGVDFDDPDYGFKEESKGAIKEENEEILKTLCQDCEGTFGTLAQAVDELQIPRVKSTKPVHSYRGFLTLGNVEVYDTALSINVERFPKTSIASAPSASKFVLRNGVPEDTQSSATMSNGDGQAQEDAEGMSAVKNARTYQINDEDAPGGKRDVAFEELSKGYEYGRTAVHIAESDRNVTTFETKLGLDIIGFIDTKQFDRYLKMGKTHMIIAQKHNDKASMALSSLIHALWELESYAVARLVPKDNREPEVVLLAPNIEPDFECLYEVQLPYAEDVRSYKFPPLDRVVTVSGKDIKVHRNLPTDELKDAMSAYVDSMDLSTFAKDDDGEGVEYAPADETFSPNVHRLNQVIRHRAIFPESDAPPPSDILTKYSQPPQELVDQAKRALDKVIKAAEVKKVPPKARGKRWNRKDTPKPLSDLDVGALLATDPQRKGKRIDPKNAIPEFKQMLESAKSVEELHESCKQLKFIILDWVKHSVGGSKHALAIEAIGEMRSGMVEMEEPGPFNEFMKDLKNKIEGGELGGDQSLFWYLLRRNRVKPILKSESESSEFTEEAAKQFMMPSAS